MLTDQDIKTVYKLDTEGKKYHARLRLPIKKDCYWWLIKTPSHKTGCAVLTCLQCTKDECSFYETERQYKARQEKFTREHPNLSSPYQNLKQ